MANTKLPSRLLDTSAIPALNVTGDLTVDTTTLKVDSTNNRVGIGIASPQFALDVGPVGASGGDGIRINAARNATLRFLGNDTSIQADEITGRLEWYTSDTNNPGVHAQILTRATNTAGSGEMQIWSGTAGGIAKNVHFRGDQTVFNEDGNDMDFRVESDTLTHALFVQGSDGKVGIGTSTPHGKLQFATDINTRKIVLYEGGDNDYQFYGFGVEASTLVYSTYEPSDDHVFFSGAGSTSRTELMRIEGTGNVGIGTSSPSALLHLKSTANSTGPSLIFENTNNAQSMNIDYWNNGGAVQSRIQYSEGPAAWDFIPNVSSGSALHIAYDRTVGIGHTSPKSKLSIVSDGSLNTYSGVIGIENTAQDKWGSITLTDDIDTASSSSNYYLIGRGSTYAQRYMSFHIPTAANYGSGSQPKFVFASTGSDELFTVEASTGDAYHKGKVTMPYQPGFKAAWASRSATGSGRILSTDASDTVTTGRDEYNTGSHFSTATGRFTAPVAGTYLLGFQAMRHGTDGASLECRIKKNGAYMWARAYQGAFDQAHQYWSIVTTTKCAAGDYFQVYIGPSTSIYNDDTYFYGHLLG